MNLKKLLYKISSQGIKVWAEGDELKVNAPKGSLTAEIREVLSQNKIELLQLLQQRSSSVNVNSIPLVPVHRDRNFTLSYQQERLWSVAQLMPDNVTLNLCQAVRLQGLINIQLLQNSWQQIIDRHEILRTSFALVEGALVQVSIPKLEVSIVVEDNSNLSESEIEDLIEENIAQESRRSFDLAQAPLFNLKWLRFGDTDGALILVYHHIIGDGLSINLLTQELLTLYDASLEKKPSPLTDLDIQYGDYAVWQRQWLQGEVLEKGLNYWQQQLTGVSTLYPVPVDNLQLSSGFESNHKSFQISASTWSAVQQLSSEYSITPVVVFLSVFYVLIVQYSLKSDIVVGLPVSGRVHPKLQSAIGFFTDIILLRTQVDEHLEFKELLSRVKEVMVEAYANQHIPLNYVAEFVEHHTYQQYKNLFQLFFDYIDFGENAQNHSNFKATKIEGKLPTDIDLFFTLFKVNQEIKGGLTYNANWFEEETIIGLIDSYLFILEQCLETTDRKVTELELSPQLKVHFRELHSQSRKQVLLKTALESIPEVQDYAIVTRDNQDVAYVVVAGDFSVEKIESFLQDRLSSELLPAAYVPVSTLPRTELGEVDEAVLAAIEVMDADLIARWEEKLRSFSVSVGESHPEIEEAVVMVQYHPAPVMGTRGRGDAGTRGRGDAGTERERDTGTRGRGDAETGKIEILPESSLSPSTSPCQVDEIAASVEFETWTDLLPGTDRPAILGVDGRKPLTHAALKAFVQSPPDNANLSHLGIGITERVCAAMPNGSEAAVAFLSLAQQCVFAPISLSLTEKQVLFELEDLSAVALILQRGEANQRSNAKLKACAESLGVRVIELIPDPSVCGVFTLEEVTASQKAEPTPHPSQEGNRREKPTRDHVALVLHTSGTTRKPKTVPLTHGNLTAGSLTISRTIALTPEDTCINIMPLFHIHGLSVNILASLLAGASVLCTPGLYGTENGVADFFRWLQPGAGEGEGHGDTETRRRGDAENGNATPNFPHPGGNQRNVTWYSAVPTMHQAILEYAEQAIAQTGAAPQHSLRLIRNCSAALLPAIAERMAKAFNCEILPTYAMTESMPICSPQLGQGLAKHGSVGPAAGPQLIIGEVKENDAGQPTLNVLPPYSEGEVMVKGACVTAGYELRDWMDYNPNEEAFIEGWLRTGDKGYLDEDGYVYLVGRFKEIINRAGEKISPMLVEDVLQRHPGVGQVVVFAAPHEVLGEVVGAAIVPVPNQPRPSLAALRQFALKQKELELQWLPECLVWMSAIPKGMTGKPARIGLAKRLGLPVMAADATTAPRTFVATEGADGKFSLETIDNSPAQTENGQGVCQKLSKLTAYFTSKTKNFPIAQLQQLAVRDRFGTPSQILPTDFVQLEAFPLTPDGKIDRKRLRELEQPQTEQSPLAANETQQKIASIWQEVLQLEEVGITDNFFELGGKSILLIQVYSKLREAFVDLNVKVVDLLTYPTVDSLSRFIIGDREAQVSKKNPIKPFKQHQDNRDIAIIGMSGRFPGAKNLEEFWENLKNGVESISSLSDQQLLKSGVTTEALNDPNYVKVNARISDIDMFDADFFNYSRREATEIDPQQRLFLESAWEAIENGGYNPKTYQGSIGVYAGGGIPSYLISYIGEKDLVVINKRSLEQLFGNDKDYLATRAAYKLNLTGPAINVQTACSTSLVAVHLACQSLLSGECDMALAGGVSIQVPQEVGYTYQEGMIFSPDGHCRPFDANAQGTVFGNGVGVVLLKPLSQAIADGDCIQAVIKGSAINNDGSFKLGYTAPSVDGQIGVISRALAIARINPETITYIEAHGTGTELGDPIELEALTKTFSEHTQKKQFCAVGSVKSNVGHLNTAAGVVSLIKTVLALKHGLIPPSLHFKQPSPQIDFPNSPFYVNTHLSEWSSNGTPRRAGVSSFGIGGTNAHLVLEEAPRQGNPQDPLERSVHLLTLSAKTQKALEELVSRYCDYLGTHPESDLADICYTANTGRVHFNHRLAVIANSQTELAKKLHQFLGEDEATGIFSRELSKEITATKVAFLFTGQGSQYLNMARKLYEQAPVFRAALEQCNQILSSLETFQEKSLLEILYPAAQDRPSSSVLDQTAYTQPALFAIEYALFKLWESWGIKPDVIMGHSVGEYVAATVAGVFSLEDGLKLIAMRGQLMQKLPSGGKMVSIMASESQVTEAIKEYSSQVTIAAVNGPESIVISGESAAIDRICSLFESKEVTTKQLQVSHAFHSPLMEPMLTEFTAVAKEITYNQPKIPLISNVTGKQADDSIASAQYWVTHVRQPVKFVQGIQTLHKQGATIFLEIGPKPVLLGMGRQCLMGEKKLWLPSLRSGKPDWLQMLQSLGELYVRAINIDWLGFDRDYYRHKVELPTYPWQRKSYWITDIRQRKAQEKKMVTSAEKVKLDELNPQLKDKPMNEDTILHPPKLRLSDPESVYLESAAPTLEPPAKIEVPQLVVQAKPADRESENVTQLKSLDTNLAQIKETLKESLAVALYAEISEIEEDQKFVDLGLDSIVGVEWITEINKTYNFNLKATKLYDYPTLLDLAQYIADSLSTQDRKIDVERSPSAPTRTAIGKPSLPSTPSQNNFSHIKELLKQQLAEALYADISEIEEDQKFVDLGLDSIVGVEWITEINKTYNLNIKATKLYDYPTLLDFTKYITQELGATQGILLPKEYKKTIQKDDSPRNSQEDMAQKLRSILKKVANKELTVQEGNQMIQQIKNQAKT
ncbi:condensation domain-containing protein [Roseofilum sp. BLCC_M91]|uniref:Condensation domain-containing protein n=1 Tax=Roseofilum halophilum BLCC-M91 TaxID=3022259 RepID=A0ABT7BJ09_9CYAN|nr:type I polyketide synthase [Roseofilum halophilum]MDJ1179178.1 condensation domain-containing protein [Roseofilum halophilum BLCC-M91]